MLVRVSWRWADGQFGVVGDVAATLRALAPLGLKLVELRRLPT